MARLAVIIAFVLAVAAPGTAASQGRDLPFSAFFGTFEGGGVAESADSLYFGVTARDFDVRIRPEGAGFAVSWTGVIRGGGTPGNPEARRKTHSVAFVPSARAGVFRAARPADPVAGDELAWAAIAGNTLSVYLMVIGADGGYEVQRYDRTLSGTGMELVFTRVRDGETVRTVKGRLVKTAN